MGRYYGGNYVPDANDAPGTPVSQNPNQGTSTLRPRTSQPRPPTAGRALPGGNWYDTPGAQPSDPTPGNIMGAPAPAPGSFYTNGRPRPGPTSPSDIYEPPPPASSSSGAAAPTEMPWVPYSAPGYSEDYYTQHKGFWDQPGAASQYWNGVQGYFAPGNPTSQETSLDKWGNQLHDTTGAAESRYADNARSGLYDQPGAAESFWSKYGDQMMAPTRAEGDLGNVLDMLKNPGAAESYWASHSQDFDKPGAMENLFPAMRDQLSRYSQSELLAQGYKPESSYAENWLTGGGAGAGLDQMYNRLYQVGSKRLGDEGAARGSYNSGASLRAAEELNSDLTGKHVQDYSAAVNAADAAKMQRLGYGLNVMKAADDSMLGRMTGLTSAGSKTDEAMRERELAGGTLSNQAEQGMLGRADKTTGAATALGNLVRQRYDSGSQASDRAQKAATDRGRAGMEASHTAEKDWMDRLEAGGRLTQASQNLTNQRYATGGTLAAAAGTEDNTRVTSGMNASHLAAGDQRDREASVLDNLMKVASSKAGLYASMTDKQRQEELQLQMTQIQGLLHKGKISSETANQMMSMYMQLLGSPIAAAGAITKSPATTTPTTKPPAPARGSSVRLDNSTEPSEY